MTLAEKIPSSVIGGWPSAPTGHGTEDASRLMGGATLVEYGVALIVAVVVGAAAISALADAVGNELSETASAF